MDGEIVSVRLFPQQRDHFSSRISHLGSLNFDRCSLNIGGRFRQKNFWQADFVPDQRSDASFWISGV